jgi:KTSC domain
MGLFDWFSSFFGKGKQARAKTISDDEQYRQWQKKHPNLSYQTYEREQAEKARIAKRKVDLEKLTADAEAREKAEQNKPAPEKKKIEPRTPLADFLTMGKWLAVTSTNVAQIAYSLDEQTLFVQFHPGKNDPSPRYWYKPINAKQAQQFALAPSKGGWVWDHLRIRGTKLGHKVPYGRM